MSKFSTDDVVLYDKTGSIGVVSCFNSLWLMDEDDLKKKHHPSYYVITDDCRSKKMRKNLSKGYVELKKFPKYKLTKIGQL
jgi:hypothetical protein